MSEYRDNKTIALYILSFVCFVFASCYVTDTGSDRAVIESKTFFLEFKEYGADPKPPNIGGQYYLDNKWWKIVRVADDKTQSWNRWGFYVECVRSYYPPTPPEEKADRRMPKKSCLTRRK